MSHKTVTIYQTESDTFEPVDSIQIEIEYMDRIQTRGATHDQPAEYEEAHVTDVTYEGRSIDSVISDYFDESELLNVPDGSDLTTERNLFHIKILVDEFAQENDYKYQPFKG